MAELSEGLLAVRAAVGLHTRVDADVLGQVAGVGKRLGAVGALVGLGLGVISSERTEEGEEQRERERERERKRDHDLFI